MTEECFDKYFMEFDFFDGDCFKAVLSKTLGYVIIAKSLVVKVPQILKILNNKSAEGINFFSVCLELFAITLHLSYNFVKGYTFSAYGDGAFVALQTLIIACLVSFFNRSALKSALLFVAHLGACYVLMGGMASVEFLYVMQAFNIPIFVTGKLSQAWTNYKNSSTGQLSAITCIIAFIGTLARIFTSIQETGDSMMILTYSLATLMNGIIVAQLVYYWKAAKKKKSKKSPKKASKTKSKPKKID